MALTTCDDCRQIISRSAISCPKCGCQIYPIKTAVIVLISLIMSVFMYLNFEEWDNHERRAELLHEECRDLHSEGFYDIIIEECTAENRDYWTAANMVEAYGVAFGLSLCICLTSSIYYYKFTIYKKDPSADEYDDEY